jgi:hypothetical protein
MKQLLKLSRRQEPSACKIGNNFCSKRPLHVPLSRSVSCVKGEQWYNKTFCVLIPGRLPGWPSSLAFQGFGRPYVHPMLRAYSIFWVGSHWFCAFYRWSPGFCRSFVFLLVTFIDMTTCWVLSLRLSCDSCQVM